jgi:hypothetical protein
LRLPVFGIHAFQQAKPYLDLPALFSLQKYQPGNKIQPLEIGSLYKHADRQKRYALKRVVYTRLLSMAFGYSTRIRDRSQSGFRVEQE